MKKLILINGTMGVGKTTISEQLYLSMNNSCWLDGDWCWMMNPFKVTEENKSMVLNNISHILNNFLKNSNFKYIIFNWVMHHESIIDEVLNDLNIENDCELYKITLMCSKEELEKRFKKDIKAGKRDINSLTTSIERLELYNLMNTIKVDVGNNDILKTVGTIKQIIGYKD